MPEEENKVQLIASVPIVTTLSETTTKPVLSFIVPCSTNTKVPGFNSAGASASVERVQAPEATT